MVRTAFTLTYQGLLFVYLISLRFRICWFGIKQNNQQSKLESRDKQISDRVQDLHNTAKNWHSEYRKNFWESRKTGRQPIRNLGKTHCTKKDVQTANNHLKRCSATLVEENANQNQMQYHYTAIRTATRHKTKWARA